MEDEKEEGRCNVNIVAMEKSINPNNSRLFKFEKQYLTLQTPGSVYYIRDFKLPFISLGYYVETEDTIDLYDPYVSAHLEMFKEVDALVTHGGEIGYLTVAPEDYEIANKRIIIPRTLDGDQIHTLAEVLSNFISENINAIVDKNQKDMATKK